MTFLIQSCWTCPEKTTQAPAGPQALCPCALSLAAARGGLLPSQTMKGVQKMTPLILITKENANSFRQSLRGTLLVAD